MNIRYKNLAVIGIALTIPLKSEKLIQSRIQKAKNIAPTEIATNQMNSEKKEIAEFLNAPIEKFKAIETNFLLNFPKVAKPSRELNIIETKYVGSPKFLDSFLEGGVMQGKGEAFCKAQEKHGINAVFLVGVANHESYYGKSDYAKTRNNIAGMRGRDGYLKFDSVEECIDKMAENLKNNYVDRGLTTISQINKRYAESNAWSDAIITQMEPIYTASQCKVFDFRGL